MKTIQTPITVEDIDALELLPIGIVVRDIKGEEWRKETHDIWFHLGNEQTGGPDLGVWDDHEVNGAGPLVILNPELLALSVADGASAAAV